MQDDELWAVVDQRRRSVVDLLTDLSPAEWEQPSLCAEWSVPDVAAHLSLHPMRPTVHLLLDTLRARGDTNRLHPRHGPPARRGPDRRPDRDDRGGSWGAPSESRPHRARGVDRPARARTGHRGAAGLHVELPPEPAAAMASWVWAYGASASGRRKMRVFRDVPRAGFRFTATDIEWAVGSGPEIRGPVGALLLLLTGRSYALEQVDRESAEFLRAPRP